MKTILLSIFHGCCLAAIFLLSGFIFREKMQDREVVLQGEVLPIFQFGCEAIRLENRKVLKEIEENSVDYPHSLAIQYLNRAKTVQAKADSLLILLDSLAKKPDGELAKLVGTKAQLFKIKAHELVDFEVTTVAAMPDFSFFEKGGWWLFDCFEKYSEDHFQAILAQTKVNISLIEQPVFLYCLAKNSGSHDGYDKFSVFLITDKINPTVRDTISSDLVLSLYSRNAQYSTFTMNGQKLDVKDGVAKFRMKWENPGIYPLQFGLGITDSATDSVGFWEKTFLLNIRK